jgi:molecular chaperone DnaK (HSP70)
MNPIGIDFGTTNSVVAAFDGTSVDVLAIDDPPVEWARLGFDKLLPSVLGVSDSAEATFGWRAKRQPGGKLQAVKRLFATEESVDIGGSSYSVEMAAALLFARLKQGSEDAGVPLERAVVTVPANSRGLARFRTKLCAGLAGIEVSALINEPTAAAMAHSIRASDDQTILVFDWGGGTLDVTVLETIAGVFIERASKGIQRSGGIDLDRLLEAAVLREVVGHERWSPAEREWFTIEIERAKVVLSTDERTSVSLPGGNTMFVTRSQLEAAIRPKIEETRRPIEQCLKDLSLPASAIDHLVLVGGSSKIPALREFVCNLLGKEPAAGTDAMTAVAEGAAIAAAVLAGQLDNDFFVATEHALGTVAADDHGRQAFSVLIDRNHQLPAQAQGTYLPVRDGQETVLIRVIEGDPAAELEHPDNVILKEWEVNVDPLRTKQEAAFTIDYHYDVDGILHVTVTDLCTGAVMLKDDVSFGVSKDKPALVRLSQSVRDVMTTGQLGDAPAPPATAPTANGPVVPSAAALIERVRTKITPFLDDVEAARLEALCAAVEAAGLHDVAGRQEELDRAARAYSYLF